MGGRATRPAAAVQPDALAHPRQAEPAGLPPLLDGAALAVVDQSISSAAGW